MSFQKPKSKFSRGQIACIVNPLPLNGYYLLIRSCRWVKKLGSDKKCRAYSGSVYKVEGEKIFFATFASGLSDKDLVKISGLK